MHINEVGNDFYLVVNDNYSVDVYSRSSSKKVKTLDVEYMRYSIVMDGLLFIGTEEKILYMLDLQTFDVIDRI